MVDLPSPWRLEARFTVAVLHASTAGKMGSKCVLQTTDSLPSPVSPSNYLYDHAFLLQDFLLTNESGHLQVSQFGSV